MLYPFQFQPIFKTYLWGGRHLDTIFHKPVPATGPVAESWEIVDRADDNSVVAHGPLAGKTLRWLMEHHGKELLGDAASQGGRFPLMLKLLDANERLSLQVHPPAAVAAKLGGEPKTEMWHVIEARPGACFYVGLKRGVSRRQFEAALRDGTVAHCFHRVEIRAGDTMFVPAGRVHAIGGHCMLVEIQQNSDTTYRVHDWGRVGSDGRPRTLHIEEALQCIDFNDFEPGLVEPRGELLVECRWFVTERWVLEGARRKRWRGKSVQVLVGLGGRARIVSDAGEESLRAGEFVLLPAAGVEYEVAAEPQATFLRVSIP